MYDSGGKVQKTLIVGGAGYIGSVVCEYLLDAGHQVISYDRLLYKNNLNPLNHMHDSNYSFLYGDVVEKQQLSDIIQSVDNVVLLAGLVGDPITKKYPGESASINDIGVKNVIDLCAQYNTLKLVFISTCSNYGLIKEGELADEKFQLNPLSLYAKSKTNAEEYIISLQGKTDMNPTILRFATAFGLSPRMRFDLTISEFTRELALGKTLEVYDPHTWRPYCHVKDFARLITMVLDAPKDVVSFEVFNAGGDSNNATKQMIIEKLRTKLPSAKVTFQKHGSDPRNYRVNFNKVQSTLGFHPQYTIQNGIDELLVAMDAHVFDNVEENRNYFGNYEINYETIS
jgi:nucleoside-diphosphate-sugar epimerase